MKEPGKYPVKKRFHPRRWCHARCPGCKSATYLIAADAPIRIKKLTRHPKLKGLRPMLQDFDDTPCVLHPALAPALQAMAECELMFDALIKPIHLPHLLTLAARYHDLLLVIDHAAKPDIAAGEWQPWADGMAQLAVTRSGGAKHSICWPA